MLPAGNVHSTDLARPLVRWWWLSGVISEDEILRQLQWIRRNSFGGVELAWIHPSWLEERETLLPRPAFLSAEWIRLVMFTKQMAGTLGLSCDFTFGSSWPFGGSWVDPADAAQTFCGRSAQRLSGSWESAPRDQLLIVNHLSAAALNRYAEPLLSALAPALAGGGSALFCDSLEISTEQLWSSALWNEFAARFGYRLEPFIEDLDRRPAVRYDYRKLRGEVILREFYQEFAAIAHRAGALARVQCHGAPTDLLAAYAAVDIPEAEALLFLPPFSRIAASAAAWAGRNVVSAETFTCIYGFPGWDEFATTHWKQEQVGDLKLLADALFANGVNQLVWHGMPFASVGGSQEFYASVHVGPDSSFASSLPALNSYFTTVSSFMREGETYGALGVYLPYEDALMLNRLEGRTPGANYHWEMRHAAQPEETRGYAPLWISAAFLKEASCEQGQIVSGHLHLQALYIDAKWVDAEAGYDLLRLIDAGATVIWKRAPRQPGFLKDRAYKRLVASAASTSPPLAALKPLISGSEIPPFWARQFGGDLMLFFAHPLAAQIRYPMPFRFSDAAVATQVPISIHWQGVNVSVALTFGANDSVLLEISKDGSVREISLPKASDIIG